MPSRKKTGMHESAACRYCGGRQPPYKHPWQGPRPGKDCCDNARELIPELVKELAALGVEYSGRGIDDWIYQCGRLDFKDPDKSPHCTHGYEYIEMIIWQSDQGKYKDKILFEFAAGMATSAVCLIYDEKCMNVKTIARIINYMVRNEFCED